MLLRVLNTPEEGLGRHSPDFTGADIDIRQGWIEHTQVRRIVVAGDDLRFSAFTAAVDAPVLQGTVKCLQVPISQRHEEPCYWMGLGE